MFVQLTFFVVQRAWPNLAIIFSAHSGRDFQISLRVNIYIYTSSFPYKRIKGLVQASFLLVQAKESQLLVHFSLSVYFCVRYSFFLFKHSTDIEQTNNQFFHLLIAIFQEIRIGGYVLF